MATFGPSFANVAEAVLLEEEYRRKNNNCHNNNTGDDGSSSNNINISNIDSNNNNNIMTTGSSGLFSIGSSDMILISTLDSNGDLSTTEPIILPRSNSTTASSSMNGSPTSNKRLYNNNGNNSNGGGGGGGLGSANYPSLQQQPQQQEYQYQDQNGNIIVRASPNRQNSRVSIQLPPKRQKTAGDNNNNGGGSSYNNENGNKSRKSALSSSSTTTKTTGTGASSSAVAGTGLYSADDVILQLQRAMSTEERQEAIENAIDTFDHTDRTTHDNEIRAGADIALVKLLTFLEFKSGFRRYPIEADMEVITHEIGQTLKALECVYRSSTELVATSFDRVGTDLLQMLVIYIDDEIKNRTKSPSRTLIEMNKNDGENNDDDDDSDDKTGNDNVDDTSRNNSNSTATGKDLLVDGQVSPVQSKTMGRKCDRDTMLLKATKILGHFARAGKASKPLCHFPGLLGGLILLLNLPLNDVPYEARLSCLWTIANVACNPSNMQMMMSTPNLINSLISIGVRQPGRLDSLETMMEVLRAKSIVSRSILNLAWDSGNKIFMAENVALVQMLSQLSLERQPIYPKSKTMKDIMTQTRRHSIGALRHITAAPNRSKIALCRYGNGKLLDVLTDITLNETDSTALDLVYAAIHNLVVQDTAEDIVNRPALVLALTNAVLEEKDDGTNTNYGDGTHGLADEMSRNNTSKKKSRKDLAEATIQTLERVITPDMPSYETLRELLDSANPSNTSSARMSASDLARMIATPNPSTATPAI